MIIATQITSPILLFTPLFIYGAGTATNLQGRYAGTDLAPAHRRATTISIAMVATTIGAVAGPDLIEPLGGLAERLSLVPLTGPFLLAAVAYPAADIILVIMLRPDPYVIALQLDTQDNKQTEKITSAQPADKPPRLVWVGALVMVISQMMMVGIMTMTPVHMRAHDHSMGAGLVIGLHVGAKWLPSLITGPLVDPHWASRHGHFGGPSSWSLTCSPLSLLQIALQRWFLRWYCWGSAGISGSSPVLRLL